MSRNFAFITTDEYGRPKKSDGLVIRSHCMKGKNKRIDSRRSKRNARKIPVQLRAASEESYTAAHEPIPCMLLPNPASDLQLVQFIGKVDGHSRELLYKFLAYSVQSNLLYPVEHTLNFQGIGNYLEWLNQDAAYLHSVLLNTCAINDFVTHQPPTPLTRMHLRNTLSYLNSKLSEEDGHTPDSVIFIVLTLGITAVMFEDYSAAGTHLRGLEKIIRLRGGYEYLRETPKMYFKMERLNLSLILSTGKRSLFFDSPISWGPFFTSSLPLGSFISADPLTRTITSPRLAIAYNDLRCLTNLINDKDANKTKMEAHFFQCAIHSIQFRLIGLEGMQDNPTEECLRLGLLAFLTTTFRVPGRKMRYPYLTHQLREGLAKVDLSTQEAGLVVFWVSIMSMISIFEFQEPWVHFKENHKAAKDMTWEEAKDALQLLLWIPCCHDEPGQKSFSQMNEKGKVPIIGPVAR